VPLGKTIRQGCECCRAPPEEYGMQ
jgi:hypothetical protein